MIAVYVLDALKTYSCSQRKELREGGKEGGEGLAFEEKAEKQLFSILGLP